MKGPIKAKVPRAHESHRTALIRREKLGWIGVVAVGMEPSGQGQNRTCKKKSLNLDINSK